ncbi:unnamed protein product [Chilo suppressalis]|uniref:Odorant binding protein n=1 Tax=Chilo suppressalis TaxID=168631 RepID=A0ABN8EA09_CHISP|nr:unnamed protein product [Chilo suppressalis]
MLQSFILILCCLTACRAAATSQAAVPPPATPQVYCGELPNQIYSCLKLHNIHPGVSTGNCLRTSDSCEKLSCVLREGGMLVDGKLNKTKAAEYYDNFGVENPQWAAAVTHVKAECVERDLPAQGTYLDCPAYDLMWCALTAFIRNAQPSQWSTSDKCAISKQFAASCPFCPESCFAPAVPIGSCNACYSLPRTP